VTPDRSFDLASRLTVIVRVASALHYIHERGLVHRDVKPSNIFLTRDGGVRLLDFGIALIRDERLTRTGMLMGTPHYMSPEQLNSGTADRQTDVFALGVVLYRLLTDRFPWPGDVPAQVMFAIATRPPDPFEPAARAFGLEAGPADMAALARILAGALAAEPTHRYATAYELGAAVEAFLDGDRTFADAERDAAPTVVDAERLSVRRIEWARARAARLQLDPEEGREPPPAPLARGEERDRSSLVWGALVLAVAAALCVASWYAFFADR
jgi:serine/threonine protein kinase